MIWIVSLFANVHATALSSEMSLTPFAECFDTFKPAYLRVYGSLVRKPDLLAKVDMVTCATHCRANFDPSSDQQFPCQGFNFHSGRNPTCEFFRLDRATDANVKSKQLSYYFEKTCLRVPQRCEESAFVFDVFRGFRLNTDVVDKPGLSEMACREKCLEEQCIAFEWDNNLKKCGFYTKTKKNADVQRAEGVVYFENNCIHPSSRCPNGRIDFLLVRKSDVPSFGVSVGVRSVRNCMRDCVETNLFFCQSFQFDPVTNECFISDESSDVAVPSPLLDLYEPFCVPTTLETTCNRPYAFEKLLTSKLNGIGTMMQEKNVSTDACLALCLSKKQCKSVNYDVARRDCYLLEKSRQDEGIRIGPSDNFDYYEIACLPSSAPIPNYDAERFRLLDADRTLRQDYRNFQHLKINSVQLCCQNRKVLKKSVVARSLLQRCHDAEFGCHTFAYSEKTRECIVSTALPRKQTPDYEKFTQASRIFTLYSMANNGKASSEQESATTSAAFPTLVRESSENMIAIASSTAEQTSTESSVERELSRRSSTTTREAAKLSTTAPRAFSHHTSNEISVGSMPDLEEAIFQTNNNIGPISSGPAKAQFIAIDPELLAFDGESEPRLLTLSENIGYTDPRGVSVHAECYPHGVNVTFSVANSSNPYTGAVYASERFSQCRIFAKNATNFAIFIPRPRHNTWCNALEVDGQLSAVLVMSNDRVLPHDVTTKDDLFYEVTCNYTTSGLSQVRQGIVVGGPSPIAIASHNGPSNRSMRLQILKKGLPVESVYIGEVLVARVESEIPAEKIRIVECTAHRVGGNGPPAQVRLIADGCALLPSLMSSMRLGPHGWESSLSAFRIDGSEQIDVVCMVSVCGEERCTADTSCPPTKKRALRSLNDNESSYRVDHRLRVWATSGSAETSRPMFPEVCLQPFVYITITSLFISSLLALLIALCAALRHRNKDRKVQELMNTNSEDLVAKYVKTIST